MPFQHYLFDWGDTLMVDRPGDLVPMCEWAEVRPIQDAEAALALLNGKGHCHLATNSLSSDEEQIRKALAMAGLSEYITKIYCYRALGLKKPSPEFFDHILRDLGTTKSEVIMIGDGLEKDVIGALDCGIQAVWYNPDRHPVPERIRAIASLLELAET